MTNEIEAVTDDQTEELDATGEALDIVLYKFTNKAESPQLDNLLAMFYTGAQTNTLGIMEAFNLQTEEEELVLVGVAADENGKPVCFPIAKVLKAEDVPNYLAPDGKGGFFDPQNESEAAAAREDMKSITEATVG